MVRGRFHSALRNMTAVTEWAAVYAHASVLHPAQTIDESVNDRRRVVA